MPDSLSRRGVDENRRSERDHTEGAPRSLCGNTRPRARFFYVAIESYRLTEACKLQVLAELASAKGRSDLAEDIRQIARMLLGGAPLRQPSRLTAAAVFRAAAARNRGASPH
jgi:hypothetical protein